MQDLISVIVPVHNAEDFLYQCLHSITNQSYTNLEIILVDDDSTDISGEMCDKLALEDKRVRVIHKKGKGEGGARARNMGIEISTGKYIYFMDSDDYIETDMLKIMVETMDREQSDGVICSFHYVDRGGQELSWRTPRLETYKTMSGIEAASIFLTTLNIEGFSWNKLFKREILIENDIKFDEMKNSFVDMYAMFCALVKCNRVSFCNQQFYFYRQRSNSCIHTMNMRKLSNFKIVLTQIREAAINLELKEEANFFYCFRMTMQLFDAYKTKKEHGRKEWANIVTTYLWEKTFKNSLWGVEKQFIKYIKDDLAKNSIKLLIVRFALKKNNIRSKNGNPE